MITLWLVNKRRYPKPPPPYFPETLRIESGGVLDR